MGIAPGDTLALQVEDGELVAATPLHNLRKARERYAHLRPDDGSLLSDQLIAERRAEARREAGS